MYYRVSKISGKFIAVSFDYVINEDTNIEDLAEQGTPVIIVEDLEDAAALLEIDVSKIELVEQA